MKKIYLQPDTKLLKSDLDIFMVDGSIDSNLHDKPVDGGYDDGEDEWGGAKDRNLFENGLW